MVGKNGSMTNVSNENMLLCNSQSLYLLWQYRVCKKITAFIAEIFFNYYFGIYET